MIRARATVGLVLIAAGCGRTPVALVADDADEDNAGVAVELTGLRWEVPCEGFAGDDAVCFSDNLVEVAAALRGDPSVVYDVTLRFRGVVEEKLYRGGERDGLFHVDAEPDDDPWNAYSLEVSDPVGTYYLNSGVDEPYYCVDIDYTRTVPIRGEAQVRLVAQVFDERQIRNIDQDGEPIVVPGVEPAPEPFDGQFIQMDVEDVQ